MLLSWPFVGAVEWFWSMSEVYAQMAVAGVLWFKSAIAR